jgi:hypothetical protein
MGIVQSTSYCATCQRQSLFTKPRINHVLHLILSVLTLGVWALLVWLPLGLINSGRKPKCATCGMAAGQKPAAEYAQPAVALEQHRAGEPALVSEASDREHA